MMRRAAVLMTCAATLTAASGMATSANAYESFRSLSGNIHCSYFEDGTLRCDLLRTANKPPKRPADCDLD